VENNVRIGDDFQLDDGVSRRLTENAADIAKRKIPGSNIFRE